MASNRKKRPQLLSATRPTLIKRPATLSSRKTRSIVRHHHIVRKQLQAALDRNDQGAAAQLQKEIEASGGLEIYQEASIQGQSRERGGDSSKVLMEWLAEAGAVSSSSPSKSLDEKERLRMLEVGALRVDNACSRSGLFDMERIDLHSRDPLIKEQDFMQRSAPSPPNLDAEGFDVVSLSLVVNFVGEAVERGEMLKRVGCFLRQKTKRPESLQNLLPSLFLVLPASCVTNSRYMDEEKLEEMMKALWYTRTRRKMSAKLVYYLWKYEKQPEGSVRAFKKEVLRRGDSRNNFAIILQ
ncbi:MAG: hypothetical protein Q9163_003820 [Psora crenata]